MKAFKGCRDYQIDDYHEFCQHKLQEIKACCFHWFSYYVLITFKTMPNNVKMFTTLMASSSIGGNGGQ
jgi:hypothetical protein